MHQIYESEIIVVVQHVQVLNHLLVSDITAAEAHHLVEYAQSVAHTAICFLGNYVQSSRFVCVTLALGHILQMLDSVFHAHTLEIVYLAA